MVQKIHTHPRQPPPEPASGPNTPRPHTTPIPNPQPPNPNPRSPAPGPCYYGLRVTNSNAIAPAGTADHRAALLAGYLGWTLDAFDFFLVVSCLTVA